MKELAELAEISKATFYLHYHDIYDLSSKMQKEVIHTALDDGFRTGIDAGGGFVQDHNGRIVNGNACN